MAKKKSTEKSEPKKGLWNWFKGLSNDEKIKLLGLVIGVILIPVIFKLIDNFPKKSNPEFNITNPSIHPDSTLIIKASNGSAKKNKPLLFKIDTITYTTDLPVENENDFYWNIPLKKWRLPPDIRKEGLHQCYLGFEQGKMNGPHGIYFDQTAPKAKVSIEGNSTQEKRIIGEIFDEALIDSQLISVDLTFKYGDNLQTFPVEARMVADENGRQIYEFEYQIQNIPQYSPDDSLYAAPFFYLEIRDAAGNKSFQKSTYNKFIAPGAIEYGNESAQILVEQIKGESPAPPKMKIKIPKPPTTRKEKIESGPPLIKLRVVIRTPHYVMLSWNRLPENLRQQPQAYTIRRGGKPIGTSYDTTFTDQTVDSTSIYSYQVQANGRNNLTYLSNETIAKKLEAQSRLRFMPTTLYELQVKQMLRNKNFYDRRWNPSGRGWNNKFFSQTIQGENVVIDRSTGLMWQLDFFRDVMDFSDAQKWIDYLNRRNYAGYHDWRLPTLEEAMSLMKPKKSNSDYSYIEIVSEESQYLIWTADSFIDGTSKWYIDFRDGVCNWSRYNSRIVVRGVRFSK